MDSAAVEAVARGRVWTGLDAMNRGLVDELGGFREALGRAREAAGIPDGADVALVTYSDRPNADGDLATGGLRLVQRAFGMPEHRAVSDELALLDQWRLLASDPVLALLPYRLDVR
jgi:ClpP class serine protease